MIIFKYKCITFIRRKSFRWTLNEWARVFTKTWCYIYAKKYESKRPYTSLERCTVEYVFLVLFYCTQ